MPGISGGRQESQGGGNVGGVATAHVYVVGGPYLFVLAGICRHRQDAIDARGTHDQDGGRLAGGGRHCCRGRRREWPRHRHSHHLGHHNLQHVWYVLRLPVASTSLIPVRPAFASPAVGLIQQPWRIGWPPRWRRSHRYRQSTRYGMLCYAYNAVEHVIMFV